MWGVILHSNIYDTKPDIRHRYLYMRHANESLFHQNRSSWRQPYDLVTLMRSRNRIACDAT